MEAFDALALLFLQGMEKWRRCESGNIDETHKRKDEKKTRSAIDFLQRKEQAPCSESLLEKEEIDRLIGLHSQLKLWAEAYMHSMSAIRKRCSHDSTKSNLFLKHVYICV